MKLDLIPWIVVVTLGVLLMWETNSHVSTRAEFAAYQGRVVQQAEDLMAAARAQENEYRNNLNAVKEAYEKRLSEINAIALRNYRRMRDDAATRDRIALSLTTDRVEMDDGAAAQCVVVAQPAGTLDDAIVGACAEDAAKVTAFQDYCKRNNCPVEE